MYKLNKKHGKGIYKWKNGSVYEGQFQNDYKYAIYYKEMDQVN